MKKRAFLFLFLVLSCVLAAGVQACTLSAGTSGATPPTTTPSSTLANPTPLSGVSPEARRGHAMVYDQSTSRVLLFGGAGPTSEYNDTWAYDFSANTWTKLDPAGDVPEARYGHAMVYAFGIRKAVLFGGINTDPSSNTLSSFLNTWTYDPATNSWTILNPYDESLAGRLPAASFAHAMVYDSGWDKVVLFGGTNSTASGTVFFDDTWTYDPNTNTWTGLSPSGDVPEARAGHAMVYDPTSGKVVLFGGEQVASGEDFFNDTWTYDPRTNDWTKLKPGGEIPPARCEHTMVYDYSTNKVLLFGGRTEGFVYLSDTWAYDPAVNTWTDLSPSGDVPEARSRHAMVYDARSHKAIVFGGERMDVSSNTLRTFGDTWAYDSPTNTWTFMAAQ